MEGEAGNGVGHVTWGWGMRACDVGVGHECMWGWACDMGV